MFILFLLGIWAAGALLVALLVRLVSKRVKGPVVPWRAALQWGAVVLLLSGVLSGISRRLPGAAGLLISLVGWAALHVGLGGLFLTTEVRGSDGTRPSWRWGAKVTGIAGAILVAIVLTIATVFFLVVGTPA